MYAFVLQVSQLRASNNIVNVINQKHFKGLSISYATIASIVANTREHHGEINIAGDQDLMPRLLLATYLHNTGRSGVEHLDRGAYK